MLDIEKPAVSTLPDLVALRAAEKPDVMVYSFMIDGPDETRTLTYAQLHRRATAIGAHLSRWAAPGDRVLLIYPPGLAFNEAFFGCLAAGVIACPAALPQSSKPEAAIARLRSIVANAGARSILTTSDFIPKLEPILGGDIRLIATDAIDEAAPATWTPPPLTGDTVAYLQYSSGSTGTPKGVMLTHHNVLDNLGLIGDTCHLTSTSVGIGWLPTFHDMGLLAQVLVPVFSDFPVWTMAPIAFVQRPISWLIAMSKIGATITVAPNFGFALALRRTPAHRIAELDLSACTVALCGAEPLRSETLRSFCDTFAAAGFRAEAMFPCYGLAEATLMVTGAPFGTGLRIQRGDAEALTAGRFAAAGDRGGRELVSSGATDARAEVVIADPVTLTELPTGHVGEVCVSGGGIAIGYWDNAPETERVLQARIAGHDGKLFLRTGDLGFLDDGELYVTGRLKDLIIVDGYNHYPQDIEFTAQHSHPAIRDNGCAAFQVEDGERGRLVVVIEIDRRYRVIDDAAIDDTAGAAERGDGLPASEIAAAVQRAIGAEHGLRIDELVLARPQTIPLTSSGKLQRYACRELHVSGELTALMTIVPTTGAVRGPGAPTPLLRPAG